MIRRVLPWLVALALVAGMAAVAPVNAASNERRDGIEQQKKKKKKPKPSPSPAVCAAYTPGEQGAGAEMSIVTDAATEEAPIEVSISTEAGLGAPVAGAPDNSSHAFHNIQVDTASAAAGLYVRLDFPILRDYDLYLNDSGGAEVASATGFNQLSAALGGSDGDAGGHSEGDSETLVGISSPDCFGYTLDVSGFFTEGGSQTLSLWLGEVQYTPGG